MITPAANHLPPCPHQAPTSTLVPTPAPGPEQAQLPVQESSSLTPDRLSSLLTPEYVPNPRASVSPAPQDNPTSPKAMRSPAGNSPALDSPAINSPEPAATHCSSSYSAAVVTLVVRVGLQGHICWSHTGSLPPGLTIERCGPRLVHLWAYRSPSAAVLCVEG